jgi:murein DD-endopeptidase MepM/ murein hydrolase activator NlpD
MRSQGQVRFIKISSRVQLIAAGAVAALTLAWLLTMSAMIVWQFIQTRDRLSLLNRAAEVASAESRVSSYRSDLAGVATDLEKRQDLIDQLVEAHLGDLPEAQQAGETVSDSRSQSAQTVAKISALIPEAAGLARAEARQLAFVEALTRLADRRSAKATEAMRKLGLDPRMALASLNNRAAQGGPLMRLATSTAGKLDPRFHRLGLSLARMEALERGLRAIPQVLPASLESMSSGFGYRSDPFTGEGALHAGLDFRGPHGAPIYAAAQGTITFAGVKQGYGNVIDISHGNGMMTRYAHMSAFRARLGQEVAAGAIIGAIGNTGRSTGPHLHFEVRINDRPVNPRPFLEAAPHVLEEARDHGSAANHPTGE